MLKLTERSSVALITKPPAVRTLRNLSLRPWPYLTQSESTEMIFTLSSTGGSTPSQKTFVRVCWPTLMQRPFLLIVSLHPAATPYCVEHRRHSSRLCCRADACAAVASRFCSQRSAAGWEGLGEALPRRTASSTGGTHRASAAAPTPAPPAGWEGLINKKVHSNYI